MTCLQPALAKNLLKALRALFAWAVKNDHVPINPCDGVEPVPYKTESFPAWMLREHDGNLDTSPCRLHGKRTAAKMRLLDTIAVTKTGDLHFIVKDDGEPFTSKESFGNWFCARCRDAKIKKSAHGLRKLAATLAANDGASAHELMAQFSWLKVEQAETCTRKADRKRLGVKSSGRVSDQMENIISRPEKQVRGTSKKMQ